MSGLDRFLQGEKSCYKAVTKQAFDNFMNPETLSLMALTFSMASKSELFENFDLDDNDKKMIEKELKNVNKVYEFKNKPFETTKSDKNILKVLEHNIKFGKCIIVEYPKDGEMIKTEVKPYKIVFINENFYLACEVEHEYYMFIMYRISKINTVEEKKKTFQKNTVCNFSRWKMFFNQFNKHCSISMRLRRLITSRWCSVRYADVALVLSSVAGKGADLEVAMWTPLVIGNFLVCQKRHDPRRRSVQMHWNFVWCPTP